ncbi:MAG: vanadium-dependent haloperoxidase [Pseudonocardiaceae bacterium]
MLNSIKRRITARKVRVDAAEEQFLKPNPVHANNGDEDRYPNKIGSSTKGLAHDPNTGEVIPEAYAKLLAALRGGRSTDFDALASNGALGCGDPTKQRRFVNPQSAYAYDLEGIDSHQLTQPPAPAFASAQEAGEMVELYWMSLLRDVPFAEYDNNPVAIAAAEDLSKLSDFRGPKVGGKVTTQTLFRDEYPGCTTGPYVSQFLLQPVNFGAQSIDTRILTNTAGIDFNTTFTDWLSVINGCQPPASMAIAAGPRVYAYNGRAVAQYVHTDFLYQAYFVACVNLLGGAGTSYLGDAGNPYGQFIDHTGTGLPLPIGMSGAPADIGFGTFGGPAIATLVCEPATRALKHQWYQKWLVHRRLRPEEFGGHVEVQNLGRATYPFHPDLFKSTVLGAISAKFGSHLLPVAFPEGSPLHTAYGSGHATVAGACVTMLKWFFDESAIIENPMVPEPGKPENLIPYVAPKGEEPLTVGGELNKLASNISQARNIAGVHWRTDASAANRLGEEVAIAMLEELGELFNEPYGGFSVTRFDGTTIRV